MISNTRKVGLEGIKINAPVGYFEEERIIKNDFEIDIYVVFEANSRTEELHQTVDYTQLYETCIHFFKIGALLIETVGQNILDELKHKFPFADVIYIKIKKLSPALNAQIKNSFVELYHQK